MLAAAIGWLKVTPTAVAPATPVVVSAGSMPSTETAGQVPAVMAVTSDGDHAANWASSPNRHIGAPVTVTWHPVSRPLVTSTGSVKRNSRNVELVPVVVNFAAVKPAPAGAVAPSVPVTVTRSCSYSHGPAAMGSPRFTLVRFCGAGSAAPVDTGVAVAWV